jgi:hypothetical protein
MTDQRTHLEDGTITRELSLLPSHRSDAEVDIGLPDVFGGYRGVAELPTN